MCCLAVRNPANGVRWPYVWSRFVGAGSFVRALGGWVGAWRVLVVVPADCKVLHLVRRGAGLGEFGALRGRVLGSLGSVSAQGWVEVGALARVLGSLGSVLDLQDVR